MTPGALAFLAVAGVLVAVLPRRYAVIPVLLAAAYTTRVPVVELGPANLSVLRVVAVIGLIRVVARGERLANGVNAVDKMLVAWAILLIGMSVFHTSDAWTFRIGMVLGELGVYWLCRTFIQDVDDVRRVFAFLCIALLPLAGLMLVEKYTAQNLFSIVGGSGAINIRDGHVRAYGPFGHSILAGTVGATCVPMALCVWRSHRLRALAGLAAGIGIVIACTSSGPIMMVLFTLIGLLTWHFRNWMRPIRWGMVAAIIGLDMVMKDPVYFLMARIDLTGSSTGYHRAQLIRSSLEHLDEWWAAGTDYTRHWMATGLGAYANHADITNHFLGMGVMGGIPLMIVFILVLRAAFRGVGAALRQPEGRSPARDFLIWTLGAMLFGQVVNFWSISLFDQSVSFFYLNLAAIGAVQVAALAKAKDEVPSRQTHRKYEGRPAGKPAIAARTSGVQVARDPARPATATPVVRHSSIGARGKFVGRRNQI